VENWTNILLPDRRTSVAIPPIYVSHLFPALDQKLVELLRSLTSEEWERLATPKWRVKDVAGHLLDSNLRRLSIARDGYWGEPFGGSSPRDLIDFLNGLNADWVKAMRRISPNILTKLLEASNQEVAAYFQSLDPRGEAIFAVSWAGEEKSENWFDIAREYTEKWHHQQQIREAVGKDVDAILGRELYHPVLDTFMRAAPHSYREVEAPENTTVAIRVSGEGGGSWYLSRRNGAWALLRDEEGDICGEVDIPSGIAWRLFTKGLTEEAGRARVSFSGDAALTAPMLKMTAIVG
jgi:uncharacterized protein (TIGR03083 family)